MYLLDTNILSEMRRSRPHGAVVAWMMSVDVNELYIPAVVVGEIQIGIQRTMAGNPERAAELSSWLDGVIQSSRVINVDAEVFRIWGRIVSKIDSRLIVDALIAAIALRHNLTIVTRNVRDFEGFNVPVLNPFEHKT